MKKDKNIRLLDPLTAAQVHGESLSFRERAKLGTKISAEKFVDYTSMSEDTNQPLNPIQRAKGTFGVAKQELIDPERRLSKISLLGASAVTSAFEFVPGLYEAMIGFVGVSALNSVGNSGSARDIAISSLSAGAITGGVTAAEQALAGTLMTGTVRRFPKTFKYFDKTKKQPTNEEVKKKASNATGIMLGAPVAVVEQNLRDPQRTTKQDIKLTAEMSGKIFAFDTALVASIAAGIQTIEHYGYDSVANSFEQIAKNPALYIGTFGLWKYIEYRKNKSQSPDTPQALDSQPEPTE